MKVAVFGGTFNPLHVGHAMLADTIVRELGYDKVLFVPTYTPPHKDSAKIIPAEHRMKMIDGFCKSEGNGHFELESCEVERGGISYTSDTLEYLKKNMRESLAKNWPLLWEMKLRQNSVSGGIRKRFLLLQI